jgi:hypothetical protein
MEPATHAPTPTPFINHVDENWDILTAARSARDAQMRVAEEEVKRILQSAPSISHAPSISREQYDLIWGPYYLHAYACIRLANQMYRERRAPRVVEA